MGPNAGGGERNVTVNQKHQFVPDQCEIKDCCHNSNQCEEHCCAETVTDMEIVKCPYVAEHITPEFVKKVPVFTGWDLGAAGGDYAVVRKPGKED